MRTTVTLDSDVVALLQRQMTEYGVSFKDAVNSGLRASLASAPAAAPPPLPAFDMGEPRVPLEHALRLASELEDEEISRKLAVGR